MPTWFLLLALVSIPTVLYLICSYIGVELHTTLAAATIASAGPLTVLASRIFVTWGAQPSPHLAVWAEWTITIAPSIVVAAKLAWALHRSDHEQRADRTPAAWCARCDTALRADHAGRYYSLPGGYLCPPELRSNGTGGRRHQPADASPRDHHKPRRPPIR